MKPAIYVAYFTALTGQSVGLFYIGSGIISGVDVGGIQYDGNYTVDSTDGSLHGMVTFVLPPNIPLITGVVGGSMPTRIPVELNLPADFGDGKTVTISTPTGPVNARFEKTKELP